MPRPTRARKGPRPQYTERVTVQLSDRAREALYELAARNDGWMSTEIRAAVAAHLRRHRDGDPADPQPIGAPPWAQTNVMLKPETVEALLDLTEHTGRTLSAELRVAIDQHVRAAGIAIPDAQPTLQIA